MWPIKTSRFRAQIRFLDHDLHTRASVKDSKGYPPLQGQKIFPPQQKAKKILPPGISCPNHSPPLRVRCLPTYDKHHIPTLAHKRSWEQKCLRFSNYSLKIRIRENCQEFSNRDKRVAVFSHRRIFQLKTTTTTITAFA